jgi:NADH-quinone oxidoreductase subunit K
VFALFVIVLAAAELGVGLAIILRLYRVRQTVAVDEVDVSGGGE